MKFIDLNVQYQRMKPQVDAAIQKVLDHGQFILGPEVAELEQRLAEFVQAKHCITVSSGTTALQLALMALDIGPGDEVITTPFSFFASVEVIILLGATPVFVDIDPRTYNIDVNLIEAAITSKTKAIMPVNLYGQCADYDVINAMAKKHQLAVIEDAAQSIGGTYKGRPSGNLGTVGCTSFFPTKPLGCYGDGGACFTDDDALADKIRVLMNHGQTHRYHHEMIGINGRFDTIQAAVLLEKLKVFSEEIQERQQLAQLYNQALAQWIQVPFVEAHNMSVYAQYTIAADNRDQLQTELSSLKMPTTLHYPILLNQQPVCVALGLDKADQQLPAAAEAAKTVMSLPFYVGMPKDAVQQIASALLNLRKKVNA